MVGTGNPVFVVLVVFVGSNPEHHQGLHLISNHTRFTSWTELAREIARLHKTCMQELCFELLCTLTSHVDATALLIAHKHEALGSQSAQQLPRLRMSEGLVGISIQRHARKGVNIDVCSVTRTEGKGQHVWTSQVTSQQVADAVIEI